MRIAFISPGSFPVPVQYGGSSVETAITNIASRLPAHWNVTVLGKRFPGLKDKETRNRVTYIRMENTSQRSYLHSCIRYLKKYPHDIVQVENRPSFVPLLKKRLPCPVLLGMHSLLFLHPLALGGRNPQDCLNSADHILTNSHYLRSLLLSRYRTSTPVRPVHLGVDTGDYISRWSQKGKRLRNRLRSRFGVTGRTVVLFAGRLIPIKGVHLLLESIIKAVKQDPRILCMVVGGSRYGSNRETRYVRKLKQMARSIHPHVRFAGTIHPTKMPQYYALADLVVTPSIGQEALGLVNLEAMASGQPVISTAIGGIRETVKTGVNGILIKPSRLKHELTDAILHLSVNSALSKRLGRNGRLFAERYFSWDHTARQYARLYYKIHSPSKKGRS
jgi:spore coat protein SA